MAIEWGEPIDKNDPELIIVYGETRVGKTFQVLDMAQTMVLASDDDMQVFIFYTDPSMKRDLQNFPVLKSMGCVHARHCLDFAAAEKNLAALIKSGQCKKGRDLIVVDRATILWQSCPDYYFIKTLKTTKEEVEFKYQTQTEGQIKGGSGILPYYANGINPMFNKFDETLRGLGCHVILVCNEQEISEEANKVRGKDKNEVIQTYKSVGYRPRIQQGIPFFYHTHLFLSQPYHKRFFVLTAGEKGNRDWLSPRVELFGDPNKPNPKTGENEGLGKVYLENVCRWGLPPEEDKDE